MFETHIEVDSIERAVERLLRLEADPGPLMSLAAGKMADAVEENFAAQGRPQWLGLKPRTLRGRGEKAGAGKILQRSGRLASSIVQFHDRDSATVGSNLAYAGIQNFGGTIQRAPMSGKVRLRTDAHGNLLRQGGKGHLAVFAKDSHKRAKSVRWTNAKGWTIHIPARPFLLMTEGDISALEADVGMFLRRLIES